MKEVYIVKATQDEPCMKTNTLIMDEVRDKETGKIISWEFKEDALHYLEKNSKENFYYQIEKSLVKV